MSTNLPMLDLTSSSFQQGAFWGYVTIILAAVIIAFILGGVGSSSNEMGGIPRNVAALIWIVGLALLATGVYYGTFCGTVMTAGILNLLFSLQIILFIIWFFVYYRFGDVNSAFWGSLILFLLGLATLFFLWQAGSRQASIPVIIYLVWIGYEVYVAWKGMQTSGSSII